jgi:hypothetical protein
MLQADLNPGLLIAGRRKDQKLSKTPNMCGNPEPLVLWSSALTTCTARQEGGEYKYTLQWADVNKKLYNPTNFCGHLRCQNLSKEENV